MTYQSYSSPFAARTARQTTSFREPGLPKAPSTVFSQPSLYAGGQVPGLPSGVTNSNLAQTLFGGVTSPSGTAPGAAVTGYGPYDVTTDPIYQSIKQLGTRNVADAVSGADALRKQELINLGDATFAHGQQFGDPANPTYGDLSTEQAAAQNPYSTLAQLGKQHTGNTAAIDQAANAAGLFYGSAHANQLGDEDTRYHQGITDAESGVGSNLTGIIQQVLAAKQSQQQAEIQAAQTASANAINAAIAGGYSFGGFDANGQPILTKNPGASTGGGGDTGGDTAPADAGSTTPASGYSAPIPGPASGGGVFPGAAEIAQSTAPVLARVAAGLPFTQLNFGAPAPTPNAYLTNRNKRG